MTPSPRVLRVSIALGTLALMACVCPLLPSDRLTETDPGTVLRVEVGETVDIFTLYWEGFWLEDPAEEQIQAVVSDLAVVTVVSAEARTPRSAAPGGLNSFHFVVTLEGKSPGIAQVAIGGEIVLSRRMNTNGCPGDTSCRRDQLGPASDKIALANHKAPVLPVDADSNSRLSDLLRQSTIENTIPFCLPRTSVPFFPVPCDRSPRFRPRPVVKRERVLYPNQTRICNHQSTSYQTIRVSSPKKYIGSTIGHSESI